MKPRGNSTLGLGSGFKINYNFKPMKIKHAFLLLISFVLMSSGLPKYIQKKVDKEIRAVYQIEDFELSPIVISSEITKTLPSTFDANNFFRIKTEQRDLGYAYLAKAPSKTDEFDYLVLFDKDLIIVKSKVLIYREDYGGEIGSRRWLKQFIGKSQNDELKYGDNIAAISGATISVRSMTYAINNLLRSLKILQDKNII
jgi:Na+-translocating ferredoxin:NAD+ oxidoreductase RnfG subunit